MLCREHFIEQIVWDKLENSWTRSPFKLNRINVLLPQQRHFVNFEIWRSVYFTKFYLIQSMYIQLRNLQYIPNIKEPFSKKRVTNNYAFYTSQDGLIIFLCNKNKNSAPPSGNSSKVKCIAWSTQAAEALSISEASHS